MYAFFNGNLEEEVNVEKPIIYLIKEKIWKIEESIIWLILLKKDPTSIFFK